jgi:hypothetical protein
MSANRALLVSLVWFVFFNPFGVAAQSNFAADEEVYGVWTKVAGDYAKIIVTAEKTECYLSPDDPKPQEEDLLVIDSKWVDSDGNIFYKIRGTVTSGSFKGVKFQELDKISDGGKKWEFMQVPVLSFGSDLYPKEINSAYLDYYRCYQRSEN